MRLLRSRYFIRILFPVVLLLLAGMASVGGYITQAFIQNAEKTRLLDLESLREAKVSTVVEYLNDRIHQIQSLSYSPLVGSAMIDLMRTFQREGENSQVYKDAADRVDAYFENYITYWNYYDLFLINRSGDIVYTVKHESDFATNLRHGAYKNSELAHVFEQAIFFMQANNSTFAPYEPSGNRGAAFLAAPIIQNNRFDGVIALQINTDEIYQRMNDLTGLGLTGETVAGELGDHGVRVTIPLRHDPLAAFKRHMSFDSPIAKPIILGSQGHTGYGIMDDWRGKTVLATWEYLPHLRWGVVSKIDRDEAMKADFKAFQKSMLFLLIALIFAFWLAYIIARRVVIPVTYLSAISRRFANGEHHIRVEGAIPSNELGLLMRDMNTMMDKVERTEKRSRTLLHKMADQNELLDQKVAEKTARLASVIEYAADGIITMDIHGELDIVNPAACRIFKRDQATFSTLNVSDLFLQQDPCHDVMALVHQMAQSPSITCIEMEGMRSDGERFPMELSLSDMQGEQHKTGNPVFLLLIRDVSKAKKMREQLEHTQRLESLGVLAGGIAHDFNNLLTTIMGNAAMARSRVSEVSPVTEMLEQIESASEKAAQLCRQMLAYSGKGRFVVRAIDLNELVEEMVNLLKISIHKSTVLRLDLCKQVLPPIHADASQLQQVVMNLVINASESIASKSGVVAVRTGMVHIAGDMFEGMQLNEDMADGYYISLEVSDTGCGMDESTLGHLFDPFFTTKFTGRGLGMSATQGIIRGHHGAIKVYSEIDKGSTFKVLLPIAESAKKEEKQQHKNAQAATEWKGEGTILIVDDEETIRATASMMLQAIGFTVVTANNGKEGADYYRDNHAGITAVLLDMTMPGISGEETFRLMREINPDAQIILSSGYNEQEAISYFVGKRLTGFIQKPYSLQTLRQKMKGYLSISI